MGNYFNHHFFIVNKFLVQHLLLQKDNKMHVVYILTNLNRTAPNTVIINIIKNLNLPIKVISLGKTSSDNYLEFFKERKIEIYETKNIFEIGDICKNNIVHLNGYHPLIVGFFLKFFQPSKIICTCHSNEITETRALDFRGLTLFKSKIKHLILPILYNSIDLVVAVSKDVSAYLASIGVKNVKMIYNGIEIHNVQKKQTTQMLRIVQIGHIMPLKNQLFSLELLDFLIKNGINVEMKFYGGIRDDQYFSKLLEFVKKNNLENQAKFVGNLSFDELFEDVSKGQICIMPSLSEGLPLSLLEAMSFGLAIIVSSEGGMKELVENGKNGMVFDLADQFANNKIFDYIQSLKFYGDGYDAKNFVENNFTSLAMSNKYVEVYENDY